MDKSIGHSIEILPEHFNSILNGNKTFKIRKNDRYYQIGDKLILKEWDGNKYTGRIIKKEITCVLNDDSDVLGEYVVISIR